MTSGTAFWLAISSLLITLFAAVGARALKDFSRHGLVMVCQKRDRRELVGEILHWHEPVAVAAECLRLIAMVVLIVAAAWWTWLRAGGGTTPIDVASLYLGTAGFGVLLLAVEIWLPRALVRLCGEAFLVDTWRFWRLLSRLLAPLIWAARFVDTILHRLAGREQERPSDEEFDEEIRTIVNEGHREGLIEEDAREMIEGVIELRDATVSQIMTPRTDMVSMHAGLSLEEAVQFVIQVGHTRIPVYDKSRDDIVGILHIRDLLPELAKQGQEPTKSFAEILRQPHFVPETKPVDDLLQEFQRNRNHLAVVLDEYGGVSGLVTIEDVLEEIVGEIADEYDDALVEGIKQLDERAAEVQARVRIDKINQRLNVVLPDTSEFDTIGGFVFHELGRIPSAGEELVTGNVKITVLDVSRRRIERVRIEVLDPVERESAT